MSGEQKGKLYIGDLHASTTKEDLTDKFSKYGRLANVWIARQPPGFAFVEYDDPRDAEDALRGCAYLRINGRKVRVERASGAKSRSRYNNQDYGRSQVRGGQSYEAYQQPRQFREHKSRNISASPPVRQRRGSFSVSPPPRRRRWSNSASPPPRQRSRSNSASPPPRQRKRSISDSPPPRQRKRSISDCPPPRQRNRSISDSPPPRQRKRSVSASPPPWKRRHGYSASPPPKQKLRVSVSPPPRQRTGSRSRS